MHIVIITSMPSPYRVPLFNALSNEFKTRGWTLKLIFITRTYTRRQWDILENEFEFEYTYLRDFKLVIGEGLFSHSFSVFRQLLAEKPDVIIVGGFSVSAAWTSLYCLLYSKTYLVWTGETISESKLRNNLKRTRGVLRTFLISRARGFIVYGSAAKKYLMMHHVSEHKIFEARNTVDTEFYKAESLRSKKQRPDFIKENNLPDLNLLFVGHLEKRKGADAMLRAIRLFQEQRPDVNFGTHIIGSGSMEIELKTLVESCKIRNVYFWGFLQKRDIAKFMGICDLLIFPSISELYGLVPIEAMACGLPVLSSVLAGVTEDLVQDHVNGLVIDPTNEIDFYSKIKQVIENGDLRHRLGEETGKMITENFLITHSIRGFIDAVKFVQKTDGEHVK